MEQTYRRFKMKQTKILMCILSCQKYKNRRLACLETWVDEKHDNIKPIFVIGNENIKLPVLSDNILYTPCSDEYDHLTHKVKWFCLWALTNYDFNYIFKCDDDSYVVFDRLYSLSESRFDYRGFDIGGYASGGAGYFMSKRAAMAVAGKLNESHAHEDLKIGKIIQSSGMSFIPDGNFQPFNCTFPSADNTIITSHYCDINLMRRIKAGLC